MKYSIVLLFQALFAGATSLFTLFVLKTALRRMLRAGEREEIRATAPARVSAKGATARDAGARAIGAREYSPNARVLSLIQGVLPALVFVLPLSVVALDPGRPRLVALVLFAGVLFLGLGVSLADREGDLREENPYARVRAPREPDASR